MNILDKLLAGIVKPDQVEMGVMQCLECGAGPFESISDWLNHICLPLKFTYVAPGTDFLELMQFV